MAWLPKGGGRKSTTSEMRPEARGLNWAIGRRPKAIPPGFGAGRISGTRFFNIEPNRYLLAPKFPLTQPLMGAGPPPQQVYGLVAVTRPLHSKTVKSRRHEVVASGVGGSLVM